LLVFLTPGAEAGSSVFGAIVTEPALRLVPGADFAERASDLAEDGKSAEVLGAFERGFIVDWPVLSSGDSLSLSRSLVLVGCDG